MSLPRLLAVPLLLALAAPLPASAAEGDGVRFSMGFLAGARNYRRAGFSLTSGEVAGVAGLADPFLQPPYTGVLATGLAWDVRAVYSHVRMSAGFDLAFPSFEGPALGGVYSVDGTLYEVIPRSLSSRQVRFGLGGELPLQKVSLFLDVYGTVDWLSTELSIGGQPASFAATAFGFSLHGGLQWYLREHFYLYGAAEWGLTGTVVCNGRLGVGFAL